MMRLAVLHVVPGAGGHAEQREREDDPSAQGSPEQRATCEGDATRRCQQYLPDVNLITACLSRNRSKLIPGCRVYFSGGKKRRG
jgi:hypothetical protein